MTFAAMVRKTCRFRSPIAKKRNSAFTGEVAYGNPQSNLCF
jgi:hypothetical protein